MKSIVMILFALVLSGCAQLMQYAALMSVQMQDTARYEEVRDGLTELCNAETFPSFAARVGAELAGKVCAKTAIPQGAVPWVN